MRSAKAPAISAGVMIAKVIWKVMKTDSGMRRRQRIGDPLGSMPARKKRLKPPMKLLPFGEREAVADDHPEHRHQAGDGEGSA